jgi:serine/threonine-protein kinase
MAFEMLTGHLPFAGPDFRNQHLTENPPTLTDCPALLASLVTECLFKAADVRPTATKMLARLSTILNPSSPGANLLQIANEVQIRRKANETAAQSAAYSAAERQREIFASATKVFSIIADRLRQSIMNNAPSAELVKTQRGGFSVSLGNASLNIGSVEQEKVDVWGHWRPVFEVIAHATIDVRIPQNKLMYEGRSHSLWFCDAQEPGVLQWYETAFMFSPLLTRRSPQDPFALPPGVESGEALSPAMGSFQVAWPFTLIEPGNDVEFIERWIMWFAQAAQGRLSPPSMMPERNVSGSWRR